MSDDQDRIEALRPSLTDEFLETLAEAAKISGWSHDYTEVVVFVSKVFSWADKEAPDLEPYEDDEEEGDDFGD